MLPAKKLRWLPEVALLGAALALTGYAVSKLAVPHRWSKFSPYFEGLCLRFWIAAALPLLALRFAGRAGARVSLVLVGAGTNALCAYRLAVYPDDMSLYGEPYERWMRPALSPEPSTYHLLLYVALTVALLAAAPLPVMRRGGIRFTAVAAATILSFGLLRC